MADFGPVLYGVSKFGNPIIMHSISYQPDNVYHFTKKSTYKDVEKWRCFGCNSVKNSNLPVPLVRVSQGRFLDNLEQPKNPHFCTSIAKAQATQKQIDRNVRREIKENGKRPHKAYRDGLAEVVKHCGNDDQLREGVEQAYPPYKKLKSGYYKNLNSEIPTITKISDVPAHLKRTLVGRHGKQNDPSENLIIFEQENPNMIVMSSHQDLKALYHSKRVVGDGTFDYHPEMFGKTGQLYTLHGFINEQSVPMVYALLPNKQQSTYQILFDVVKDKLVELFGDVGGAKDLHLDFEAAAKNAALKSFPDWTFRGCLFHFSQAIQRWIDSNGLKLVYGRSAPYDLPQYRAFRSWVRRIIALSNIPPEWVHWTWHIFLRNPPSTSDQAIDDLILKFRNYIETYWLKDEESILSFNHYYNSGPRTTNYVEGYRQGLDSRFDCKHPRLGVFLHQFQKIHNEFQVLQRALWRGEVPNPRSPEAIATDHKLMSEKVSFYDWCHAPTYSTLIVQQKVKYVSDYLGRCGYLIGAK